MEEEVVKLLNAIVSGVLYFVLFCHFIVVMVEETLDGTLLDGELPGNDGPEPDCYSLHHGWHYSGR